MKFLRFLAIALIITSVWGMPTAAAHSLTATVTITESGFEPRQATLDTSSTVIFLNKDTVPHWPASNPHPTHDIYPEFDPTVPILPGGWWAFKPTKAGTWHYHDHLNPHRQGTLVVTAEAVASLPEAMSEKQVQKPTPSIFSVIKQGMVATWRSLMASIQHIFSRSATPASLAAGAFRQLPEKQQYEYVENLAAQKGAASAWQYVKEVFTSASGATESLQAHNAAHLVGSLIYKQQGLPGLALCDSAFAFGCYHGFTEGAFAKNLDDLQRIADACTSVGPISSGPWSSCIHGIGHGVASYFNATDLLPALATCDTLGEGAATFCHDGVLMEFAKSAPANFYDAANPLRLCQTLPAAYQTGCGRNIIAAATARFHTPALEVAARCLAAQAAFTSSCIDTFGFFMASAYQTDGQQIASQCASLHNKAAISQCAAAAAGELAFQNYPDWRTQAPRICEALPAADQAACFTRLQQTITNYHR